MTPTIERVIDRAERRRALDPSQSFIVQAPAGSGKTELLIQRFLTLLATVDQPESIVAVTFTRKAAGEMRHRIVEALLDASQNANSDAISQKEHQQHTRELSRRALARDQERGWRLIDHPSRLRIQTLDSLCGMLVRQMPWLSRMGSVAPPEENAIYLYREAARQTIGLLRNGDAQADSIERLLQHLDNNVGNATRLLTGMLQSRDRWLRHVVRHMGSEETELRNDLRTAMRQVIADELEPLRLLFPPGLISEVVALADFAARNLQTQDIKSGLTHCVGLSDLPRAHADDIAQWRGIASLLLTEKGERRKALNVNNGFPRECRNEKERCLGLEMSPELMRALHDIRSLPPDGFSDSQWEILSALIELLPVAAAQLKVVFQEFGKVDFTEIAHASARALGTRDNPTDLAFALDCKIHHLLVDEFQDTSYSQFQLLEQLTAEWQPGDGRTMFLVGDPMQSIYGFREAEVSLFRTAQEKGIGSTALTPLTLKVNFRSSSGIVSWVNDAVGAAFPLQSDAFLGAVHFEPSVAFDVLATAPAVHVYPAVDDDRKTEAATVLEIIRESRKKNPEGSIAVLVRARTHLPAIVNALRAANERFTAVDIDPLGSRSVVQDLLALTSALLHSGDRTAWLALLRARWCGLMLADILALAGDDFKSAIADLWNDETRLAAMSSDGRCRLERIKPILTTALAERGRLPLRRWVESTWLALGGPACLDDRTGLEDAAVYLDLLENSSSGSELTDPVRFLSDVEGLFARPDVHADGKIQLLTIHKAKGLEFDTVILPGLGRTAKSEEHRLLLWLEYFDRSKQSQLLLAPIKETGADSEPAYAYVQKILTARAANESTRLLYVAATRARTNLHILGHTRIDPDTNELKPPQSRALLHHIWDAVSPKFEACPKPTPQPEIAESAEIPQIALRRLTSGWTSVASPSDIGWSAPGEKPSVEDENFVHVSFDWATELQRRVGIVVHAMLQQMDERRGFDVCPSAISAALTAEGLDGERLREGIARVERALHSTVSDKRGRWILERHDNDQREFALTGVVDGRVRRFILDRTFVESGHRWIIDYKTGTHEGGDLEAFLDNEQERYRAQLENYAMLVSRMDSRPIRLGLYFPMLQAWREWS